MKTSTAPRCAYTDLIRADGACSSYEPHNDPSMIVQHFQADGGYIIIDRRGAGKTWHDKQTVGRFGRALLLARLFITHWGWEVIRFIMAELIVWPICWSVVQCVRLADWVEKKWRAKRAR